jgi:hypothetical protein
MTRSRFSFLSLSAAAAASLLVAGTIGCASLVKQDAPVRFVHTAEDAGSACSKVGDVAAKPSLPDTEVVTSIAAEARKQGADTVVLAKGERKGTSYKCEAPAVAKKS